MWWTNPATSLTSSHRQPPPTYKGISTTTGQAKSQSHSCSVLARGLLHVTRPFIPAGPGSRGVYSHPGGVPPYPVWGWWIWLWTEPRGTLAATANVWENQKLAHTEQTKQTPTKIRTDYLLLEQTVDRVVKGEEPVKDYKRHFIQEKCCLFYQQHISSGRFKLLWGPVHSEVANECVIWKCEMQWLATCW